MTETAIQTRLQLDDQGRVWIEGANTRIIQIAIDKYAHGWSAEEIEQQHPHLSLAQVHAALSYYYDHQAEIDPDPTDERAKVEWVIRAPAGATVRVSARHERAGVVRREVVLP